MREFIIVHQKSSPQCETIIMTNSISYIEETKDGFANIGLLSLAPSYRGSVGDVCETVETYRQIKDMIDPPCQQGNNYYTSEWMLPYPQK